MTCARRSPRPRRRSAVCAPTTAGLTADDRADLLAAADESLDRLARLARLAGSLLDVSRLQAGARAVFPGPVHVGEIVTAALEALGPQPKPVLAEIPSGLPEVIADSTIAERVIVNLAGNALRYSPASGSASRWPAAWPRRWAAPWNPKRPLGAGSP